MYHQISLIPAVHLEVACDWDLSKPNMLIENIIYNLPTDTAGMPEIELLSIMTWLIWLKRRLVPQLLWLRRA